LLGQSDPQVHSETTSAFAQCCPFFSRANTLLLLPDPRTPGIFKSLKLCTLYTNVPNNILKVRFSSVPLFWKCAFYQTNIYP
jgi:hypothetical protein